jgi:hypothetical protein
MVGDAAASERLLDIRSRPVNNRDPASASHCALHENAGPTEPARTADPAPDLPLDEPEQPIHDCAAKGKAEAKHNRGKEQH